MSSRQPQKFTQTQPETYKLTFKAALFFPLRLCNPPPAVGKVRSCGVTPLIKVRLEDILDRKHLPPLGLKDFEEWLLFVEMSPENLYFILWLREYKQRYYQWKSQSEFQNRIGSSDGPLSWSSQHSSHLAMFYARAKQTFFTPGSEYELNLTSSLLAPFHKANMPPHPDPAFFSEIELETYRTLEESLRRFVSAQFNNVGNNRVLCGIIAGIFFSLVGAIPPLALNFVRGDSRWPRLAALPGLWIGLTILLASLNGICLGVYIFGDLRQLRKFELSRPPISKPRPLPPFKRRPLETRPMSITKLPFQQPRWPMTANFTPGRDVVVQHPRQPSISSVRVSEESSHSASTGGHIQISPAYYDADDTDAATCALYQQEPDYDFRFPEKRDHDGALPSSVNSVNGTAGFIRPFEPISDDEDDLERSMNLPQRNQPMSPFDFDSLPSRPNFKASGESRLTTHATPVSVPMHPRDLLRTQIPCPPEPAAPSGMIARMQEKCNIAKWRLQTGYLEPDNWGSLRPPHSSSPYWSAHPNHSMSSATTTKLASSESEKTTMDTDAKVRKRFRMIRAVPAFAVPLTRVLSPVIVRGQWEIVVRSAIISFVVAWMTIGCLLAVPPVVRR